MLRNFIFWCLNQSRDLREVALSSTLRDNSTCKLQCTLFLKLGSHYYRSLRLLTKGAPLKIKKIGIVANIEKEKIADHVQSLKKWLEEKGVKVFLEMEISVSRKTSTPFSSNHFINDWTWSAIFSFSILATMPIFLIFSWATSGRSRRLL